MRIISATLAVHGGWSGPCAQPPPRPASPSLVHHEQINLNQCNKSPQDGPYLDMNMSVYICTVKRWKFYSSLGAKLETSAVMNISRVSAKKYQYIQLEEYISRSFPQGVVVRHYLAYPRIHPRMVGGQLGS
jgi:hypothetical protein